VAETSKKIDYINIDDTSGYYYNTSRQVELRDRPFIDSSAARIISGSTSAAGLFSMETLPKGRDNGTAHAYMASGSVDVYRQGIEITEQKYWAAGLVKISAGTPGHLVEPLCYGVATTDISEHDWYLEVETFDPVKFLEAQARGGAIEELFTFPIVTSDNAQKENYILNGIIEPIPIRPVISMFSINAPFEPQGIRGEAGDGNSDDRWASDQVLSVDAYEPTRANEAFFLDAGDSVDIRNDTGEVVVHGAFIGYFSLNPSTVSPFTDEDPPRGYVQTNYDDDLSAAVGLLRHQETTYITRKERSATAGFVYGDANPAGTDSIAFGGMLY
jgi:hypothetical protein